MMKTDPSFIGRTGVEALAAAALRDRMYLVNFMFAIGLLAAIATYRGASICRE